MKIAITGTRGVPNRYGGFEQFAEVLSVGLARKGHDVWVFNSHRHPYGGNEFKGVRILRERYPEYVLGAAANYIYDLRCIRKAIQSGAEVILECGYASAAPWYPFLRRKGSRLVTHVDGMEWMREKWGIIAKGLFRRAEKAAVRYSDRLVCDHPDVAEYYREKYSVMPAVIPYGAEIRDTFDPGMLIGLGLEPEGYCLLVARLEPENNIGMIIDGFLESGCKEILVLVGDHTGRYGRSIFRAYGRKENIRFAGGIFNADLLDHARHYAKVVFHGHSAGGTNPSLLEAMGAGALILAHDNIFNRWVLGENAFYFHSAVELRELLRKPELSKEFAGEWIRNNRERIRQDFLWETVIGKYEKLFERLA
jgi:glycosyltransferase involved in cell wall biosynthesis